MTAVDISWSLVDDADRLLMFLGHWLMTAVDISWTLVDDADWL